MHWFVWIIGITIVSYFGFFSKRRNKGTVKCSINGPPGLPIIGNALELAAGKTEFVRTFADWGKKYGPRFKIRIGLRDVVVISNAADTEKILSSTEHIDKSLDYRFLHRWLGLGLLNSRGEKWFHRRKQLTPAFHFSILEDFLKVFNDQCQTFKSVLEKLHEPFDVFHVITLCALDIICEAAMGRKVHAQETSNSEYVSAVSRISEIFQYRQTRPWFHPDFLWDLSPRGKEEAKTLEILHNFTDKVIQERKAERNKARKRSNASENNTGLKNRRALLDLMLDIQEKDDSFTDLNIREETDTFMFEGHDTTSAGVAWATFLLACHPEIQEKVYEELNSIFKDDPTRNVTTADLGNMKYLDRCIKESQRVFPSVPFIGRVIASDLKLDDGAVIPKGCEVFLQFYFLHKDPVVFPEPEKFDPDRFLLENVQGRNPFAYAPFSGGQRNCIGQRFAVLELKMMLSTIFRNFRVKPAMKLEDVVILCELITRPENGLYVTLEKR